MDRNFCDFYAKADLKKQHKLRKEMNDLCWKQYLDPVTCETGAYIGRRFEERQEKASYK